MKYDVERRMARIDVYLGHIPRDFQGTMMSPRDTVGADCEAEAEAQAPEFPGLTTTCPRSR